MNTKYLLWGLGVAVVGLTLAWFTLGYMAPQAIVIVPDSSVTTWYKPWTWGDSGTHTIAAQYATQAVNTARMEAYGWAKGFALVTCAAAAAFFGVLLWAMDRNSKKTIQEWDATTLHNAVATSASNAHTVTSKLQKELDRNTENLQKHLASLQQNIEVQVVAEGPIQSDGGPYQEDGVDAAGRPTTYTGVAAVNHRREQAEAKAKLQAQGQRPAKGPKNEKAAAMAREAQSSGEVESEVSEAVGS